MQVTVNVPDEVATEARARGLAVETYVERVLQQLASENRVGQPRSAAEVRSWLDSLAQYSDKIPPLPDVISREWLYQDHD
jgi:hypothetical protein